jgi:hypothetical protein
MAAVKPLRGLALVLVALLLAACATGGPAGSGSRARCADDPPGDALRPLIFLFCVQSP